MLGGFSKFLSGFSSLAGSPRDLYLIYAAKALESYSYFSMSIIYTIYLSDEFDVSDVDAGVSYGIWGTVIIVWGVLLGPLIDWLGVRRSLLLCFLLQGVTRVALALTSSLPLVYFMMYAAVPAADALGVPVMTIGVKRCTTATNRGFAFGLFYAIMNIAALVNGLLMDFLRIYLCNGLNIAKLGEGHWLNSGNRLIMLTGGLTSVLGFLVTLFMRDKSTELASSASSADLAPIAVEAALPSPQLSRHTSLAGAQKAELRDTCSSIRSLAKSMRFWKYLVFALVLTNLRQAFRYLDAMLPKFMYTAFGCDAPVGSTYSINPAMIIVLVPIVAALTTHVQHFDVIHFGSYISAASPLWLALWPTQAGAALFVVTLSLGEAFWSPRWYDYTMDVAPEGQEGVFGALASAPLFLAKLPTGFLSGFLLSRYCPSVRCESSNRAGCASDYPFPPPESEAPPPPSMADGPPECRGRTLWLIVGLMTIASPLLITALQKWLRPEPRGFVRLSENVSDGAQQLFQEERRSSTFPGSVTLADCDAEAGSCEDSLHHSSRTNELAALCAAKQLDA